MVRDILPHEANAYPCKREHDLRNYISFFTAGMFLPFDFLPTVSVSEKCIILEEGLEEIHDASRIVRTSLTRYR